MRAILFMFPQKAMRIGLLFLVAVVATTALHGVEAAEIMVGGNVGWRNPSDPNFYSSWAASQNFTVGDVLVFVFPTGGHDVAGVTKDGYNNCNTTNPKFVNSTTPFSFTLNTLDDFYFICTVPTHCPAGQKLAITNLRQPSSSSSPPPPGIPNPPPVSGEEPPPPPGSTNPPPDTTTPPPPPNSASSILASTITVAFLSIAVMFIIY